jgi:hypothetical protein
MDSISITHQVAVYEGFDEPKDMCDHFANNPSNTGWTSTGVGEKFWKNPFPCSKEKPPEQREALLGRFLIFYTRLA